MNPERRTALLEDSTKVSERASCPTCSKSFSRRTHMLRHAKQHHNTMPFSCQFCSKEFIRSDTLRDHYICCEYRGASPIPAFETTGRKRHACSECARLKVKCDEETPCLRCKRVGRQCLRTKKRGASDSDVFTGADLTVNRHSIQFLLKDSGGGNFAEHFPKSKEDNEGIHAQVIEDDFPTQDSHFEQNFNDSPLPSPDLDFESLFESFDNPTNGHGFFKWPWVELPDLSGQQLDSAQSLSPNDSADTLISRTTEIKVAVHEALARINVERQSSSIQATYDALEFLTAERIHSFVKLYFRHWHRHGPIIHEPTFDPSKVALPLLVSVMAIGGMYSKDPSEVSKLKLLLDTFEIVAYGSAGIEDEYGTKRNDTVAENTECTEQRQLEEFQGAYLMVVVQYWAGNPIAKKRVRQQRFMRLISIARSREALTTQHGDLTISNDGDFRSWIRRESMLRTMNIMMTLENAFGIFNNLPSRFSWNELSLELPSDPEPFKATSYKDMRDRSIFPRRKLKVTDAFGLFFSPTSPQSARFDPVETGALNMLDLQIIVHALYTFVWQQLYGSPLASVLPATLHPFIASVKVALNNWKRVWDEVKSGFTPSDLLAMGFPGSAESYWLVTRFVIHSFENKEESASMFLKADVEDTGAHLKPTVLHI